MGQIAFKSNTVARMTTTKQYDYLNRLTSISSTPSNAFSYLYNAANQRTMAWNWDSSYWNYNYDSLGQVISGNKHWVDETPVAGQQFNYTFDNIGNRTQTQIGGDQNGANLRLANYTNNNLNQITSRGVPAFVDIMGDGLATNGVTVNGSNAYRKNEYFRQQLPVTNTSAVWDGITVSATNQGSITGHVYVAQNPENYTYDADGNLLSDGRWNYTWDAENRLLSMTSLSGAPSGSLLQLTFAYDYMGRRIQKMVSTNNGSYIGEYTNKYAYDGWNCVATMSPSFTLSNSFLWGSDLSGSLQGAGGVGGLLKVACYGATTTNAFVAYDGNGNVSALISSANGATVGNYEYGPFGELIRCSGSMAKLNPCRFSTKFDDDETDLLYFGMRYLSTSRGGWLNRDPKDEEGAKVLNILNEHFEDGGYLPDGAEMNFVGNDPLSEIDVLGMWLTSDAIWKEALMGGKIILSHEISVRRAIRGLSPGDYHLIIAADTSVDDDQGTGVASVAKHAMSSTDESQSAARTLANKWVKEHMEAARQAMCVCQANSDRVYGLYQFGLALHTVQDSTSPAHWGFQTWLGIGSGGPVFWAMVHHVHEENFDPGGSSQLDQATSDLWKLLDCNTSLPDNFFHYRADRRRK